MSDELIIPLVGYFLLFAAGMLWIAIDAETAFIFDVFGKSFRYVWFEHGRRWKSMFIYGWRLLTLVLLILGAIYLAFAVASAVSKMQVASAWAVLLFVVLAATAMFLIPWIGISNRLRFQRTLRRDAKQLTPVAQSIAATSDTSTILDYAHYHTDAGWSSWHPKSMDDWPEMVPIAYVHSPPAVTVLFPVDFEIFLAWKLADQLPPAGSLLPFRGPGDASFAMRGAWPLRGVPDWSLVQADLHVDDESLSRLFVDFAEGILAKRN